MIGMRRLSEILWAYESECGVIAAWSVFADAPLEDGIGLQLQAWTSPSAWSQRERGCPEK